MLSNESWESCCFDNICFYVTHNEGSSLSVMVQKGKLKWSNTLKSPEFLYLQNAYAEIGDINLKCALWNVKL